MKVIDVLNKIAKGEEVPKKIKYNDDLYTHVDNYCYFCEETNEILSQNIYAEFSRLNDEIEVIGEPKEELEDLKEIEFAKAGDLIITIINELIKNQNYIIRELKDLKKKYNLGGE